MRYDFAPMEGITGYLFRGAHHRLFPGVDQYWIPFWSPTQDHILTGRARQELIPEHNEDVPAVPQLLTKSSADFLWAAGELRAMGYRTVNLNLGCPSGTVAAKGKGAGFLGDLPRLERFLDEIFEASPLEISIKTRLGINDPSELGALLALYRRYPVAELTVHARVLRDQYREPARWDVFRQVLDEMHCPVCCNGDLKTVSDCMAFAARFPRAEAVMIGRGLLADPAFVSRCKGGSGVRRDTLRAFSETLFSGYCEAFGSARNAMLRMKEVWRYLILLFEEREHYAKKLRKASDAAEFTALVAAVFAELELRETPAIDW